MKSDNSIQFRTDSLNLLTVLLRHYRLIAFVLVVTAVVSAAITYTIKPLFRSTVVLYPTTNVIESQTLFGLQTGTTTLFGDETATEKVLQILKSDHIKEYLVNKYDLMKHYDINPASKMRYSILDGRINRNIVSRKTQYNSVEINVLDTDPVLAAEIANDVATQIDTVFNSIVNGTGRKSYQALLNSYNEQQARVRMLEDSLSIMEKMKGNYAAGRGFKAGTTGRSWTEISGDYDPHYLKLMNMFESENENLSSISSRLTEAKMLGWQTLPYTHIINKAKVSERKALPRRSTIVAVSVLSVLVLLVFSLAIKDSASVNGDPE
ncbi:MAG: Wzz/FepE/Etk N-terminal domain-containing protein [Bacteroidales bacterium]